MESSQDIPEQGELVFATVQDITPHGVYVTLDEYGGMPGFLHISEIATGWVRNIERFARRGQKMVLKVIRIGKARREVDLSLRQVTGDEKKEKLIEVKRAEKAKKIMDEVKSRLNLSQEEDNSLRSLLADRFGSIYDAAEQVVLKGAKALEKLKLPENYIPVLEQVSREKISMPTVTVQGFLEVSSKLPNGIDVIKQSLSSAEGVKTGGAEVKITYIGSPRYRMVATGENYKVAERALEAAVNRARETVSKYKGEFRYSREEKKHIE